MMRKPLPLYLHIIPAMILITVIMGVVLAVTSFKEFKSLYLQEQRNELQVRATLFGEYMTTYTDQELARQNIDSLCDYIGAKTDTRYTVIRRDGKVLGDSHEEPSNMNNHKSRPEIVTALLGGIGMEVRYSTTLQTDHMYLAIHNGEMIVRASVTLKQINRLLLDYKMRLITWLVLAIVFAIILGLILARFISYPLEELKYRSRLAASVEYQPASEIRGSSEVVELSKTMDATVQELDRRYGQVQAQRERLRAILSGMIEGVIAFDNDEQLFLINDTAAQLFDVSREEVLGLGIREAMPSVPLQQIVHALLNPENSNTITEEITIPVGGDAHILAVRGTMLDNDRGCLLVLHDITDMQRLEHLRRDFAGNVSHELRTPLTAIKGFVETLEDGALEDKDSARHFLHIIHEQVDRLNQLIEDLLTIARLEKESEDDSVPFIVEPLFPILKEIQQMRQSSADEKSITLEVSAELPEIETAINRSLLEQALLNLVDNAIKYSPEGSSISMRVATSYDFITLTIQDNGSGIQAEHLPRLFERFYRVDKARSRTMGGTGLGLSIVKHIVGIHNGTVTVESAVDKGSTFTITLPMVRS